MVRIRIFWAGFLAPLAFSPINSRFRWFNLICRDGGRIVAVQQLLNGGRDVVEDVLSKEKAEKEAAKFIRNFTREDIPVYR